MNENGHIYVQLLLIGYCMGRPERLEEVEHTWFSGSLRGLVLELQERAKDKLGTDVTELRNTLREFGCDGTFDDVAGAIGDLQERVKVNGQCAALIDAVEKHVGRDDFWRASNESKRAMIEELKRRTHG